MKVGLIFLVSLSRAMAMWFENAHIPYFSNALINGKNIFQELGGSSDAIPTFFTILKKADKDQLDPSEKADWISSRLINPMAVLKKKFATPKPKTKADKIMDKCVEKGGVIVSKGCYQLLAAAMSFEAARSFCKTKGGDLWTPDFADKDLLKKIVPEVINVDINAKAVWVGAMRTGGKVTQLNGGDITKTYFGIMDDDFPLDSADGCALYSFITGAQLVSYDACTDNHAFICEYPITLDMPSKHNLLFSLFNKG